MPLKVHPWKHAEETQKRGGGKDGKKDRNLGNPSRGDPAVHARPPESSIFLSPEQNLVRLRARPAVASLLRAA
jgi:hypothetical protein